MGLPSIKWQCFVTMQYFGIKIPMTEHEIMLHAISRLTYCIKLCDVLTLKICVSMT